MMFEDEVFIINTNDLDETRYFPLLKDCSPNFNAEQMATYLLGRIVHMHLFCRFRHRSIVLSSFKYEEMVEEINEWLEEDIL